MFDPAKVDDFVRERVFQPIVGFFSQYDKNNWHLAQQAIVASGVALAIDLLIRMTHGDFAFALVINFLLATGQVGYWRTIKRLSASRNGAKEAQLRFVTSRIMSLVFTVLFAMPIFVIGFLGLQDVSRVVVFAVYLLSDTCRSFFMTCGEPPMRQTNIQHGLA